MEMRIVERHDNLTHVALVGRLDVTGLHKVDIEFHDATAARGKDTIVDLSGLELITSLGIGMLMGCARSLRTRGKRMVLVGAQPAVDRTLRTVGMDQVVAMLTSVDEAVKLLA